MKHEAKRRPFGRRFRSSSRRHPRARPEDPCGTRGRGWIGSSLTMTMEREAMCHGCSPNFLSEIDRPALDLPVPEACRVGAAASADLRRGLGLRGGLAPLLGFLEGAQGGGRQHFPAVGMIVVVALHEIGHPSRILKNSCSLPII
nr:hypothetical protein SHINE37_43973 [Rhizobiaceae bacterium]